MNKIFTISLVLSLFSLAPCAYSAVACGSPYDADGGCLVLYQGFAYCMGDTTHFATPADTGGTTKAYQKCGISQKSIEETVYDVLKKKFIKIIISVKGDRCGPIQDDGSCGDK